MELWTSLGHLLCFSTFLFLAPSMSAFYCFCFAIDIFSCSHDNWHVLWTCSSRYLSSFSFCFTSALEMLLFFLCFLHEPCWMLQKGNAAYGIRKVVLSQFASSYYPSSFFQVHRHFTDFVCPISFPSLISVTFVKTYLELWMVLGNEVPGQS